MKILLFGNSGCGKDLVAKLFDYAAIVHGIKQSFERSRAKEYITQTFDILNNKDYFAIFKIKRFAQPIKDFIHYSFDIPYEILNSQEKNNYKINICGKEYSIRELLIKISEDFKNIFGKDIWVDRLFNDKDLNNTIITDCRFPNEFYKAKENDFITIKIIRDEENKTDFGLNKVNEINNDDIDYIIYNNESKLSLFRKIYKIYESEYEKEINNS